MKKSIKEQTELNFATGGLVGSLGGNVIGAVSKNQGVAQNLIGPLGTPMGSVGTFGYTPPPAQVGTQVVVYGPDGTAYANPAAAIAAGVNNYTMTPPTAPAAPTGQAAAPMQAASAQFQPLGGTKFTPTTIQPVMPTFQQTIGAGVPGVDYKLPSQDDDTEEEADSPTTVSPDTTRVIDDGDGGGDGTGTSPSSTTSSGKIPSVLSLGNLFSGKNSKRGVKGESIFGSGVGVAEKYDPNKRSLSGLGALGMNPNTNFKNNMTEIGNALGIYGTDGVNVSAVFSVLTGNVLGAAGAASGLGPNTNLGYKEAPAGFGTFSTGQLNDYVSGKMAPMEMQATGIGAMSKEQAMQRAQVQKQIGTTLTGRYGFSKGSIDPNTGLVYDVTGRAVNYNGNSAGVENSFSTGKDWVDAVKASVETGYWGGPLSVQEFNRLSPVAQKNYNKKFEILGHDEAQGGVGGESKAAETNIAQGPEAGIGPTGRVSTTGRQDYSGGISQTSAPAPAPAPAPASSVFGTDYSGPPQDEGPGGEDNNAGGDFSGDEGFGSTADDDVAAPICLTEDMKVKRNGVIDFVTKVQVGDIVDNTVVTEVLHKHMREGYYKVNGELKITNDHPVLANGSWKRTEDLVLGDYINNVEVTSLEYVEQVTPTVYIGTADDRYNVYTEGEVYTVHGQYKNALNKAA